MISKTTPEYKPKKLVFFIGTNKLNPNETYEHFGIKFKKGEVKWVSDRVFEFLKSQKGFAIVTSVNITNQMDFDVAKNTVGE